MRRTTFCQSMFSLLTDTKVFSRCIPTTKPWTCWEILKHGFFKMLKGKIGSSTSPKWSIWIWFLYRTWLQTFRPSIFHVSYMKSAWNGPKLRFHEQQPTDLKYAFCQTEGWIWQCQVGFFILSLLLPYLWCSSCYQEKVSILKDKHRKKKVVQMKKASRGGYRGMMHKNWYLKRKKKY